jgi:hypothetical protein
MGGNAVVTRNRLSVNTLSASLIRRLSLDKCPDVSYVAKIPLTKGAFREGTFGKRSEMRCPRAD